MRKLFLIILIGFVTFHSSGKDKIDSLRKVIASSAVIDTLKVDAINLLSWEIFLKGDYKAALNHSKEANAMARQINYKKGLAGAYGVTASVYLQMGNLQLALKSFQSALKVWETTTNMKGMNSALSNIGVIYNKTGEFDKAIEYNFKSINIEKVQSDTSRLGKLYCSVGFTYYKMGEYEKALQYTKAGLRVDEYYKNMRGEGTSYNQMGLINTALKKYDLAIENFTKAIKVLTEAELFDKLPDIHTNIGNLYADQKKYKEALVNYEKSLAFHKESQDQYNYTLALFNMATVYNESGNLKKALELFKECEQLAKEIGSYDVLMESYNDMYKVYDKLGDYKNSLENYILAVRYRDTIFSEEASNNIIKSELKHEYDLAQIADSVKLSKEREIVAVKFAEEKTKRYALYIGLILLALTAFFIAKNLLQSKRSNKIITQKNIEVEAQKKIVEEKNALIEEKQREIIDSINYAKRIQNSLIASSSLLNQNLTEHFVLFQPKDIVSGDFYWAANTTEGFILAVADCTGHGVPGAFMSLLNISKLNEAINQKDIYRPNEVLNYVRTEIIKVLNPEGREMDSNDGMDIVLVKLNGHKLEYTAANNSFYLVRNNELLTLKADKMPVGRSPNENISFTLNSIELQKGDAIYLFTDGYADQFGGPKGKKFRYKQFEDILLANHNLDINEQRKILDKAINEWKGELEQIDDILVMGIKI